MSADRRRDDLKNDTRTEVRWLTAGDGDRWDAFVERHPLGGVCHKTAWKQILESTFPHMEGHICAIVHPESGEITAGIPVYRVRSWLLGKRFVSIPFATLSDPLVSSSAQSERLLAAAIDRCVAAPARYLEIRSWRTSAWIREPRFRASQSYRHHFVPLTNTEEQIRKRLGRTAVRQKISRAVKEGLWVETSDTLADLQAFHTLLSGTRRRLSLPPIPFRFFRAMQTALGPSGNMALLMARSGRTAVGGVLALKSKRVFLIEYAGDDARFRKAGVVQLLYWEAIRHALKEGHELFSFGRTYRGNKGLMESKMHWGTEVEDLCTFFYPSTTHRDAEDREASWQYRLIRYLASRLPDPLYQRLGEFCYSHMG